MITKFKILNFLKLIKKTFTDYNSNSVTDINIRVNTCLIRYKTRIVSLPNKRTSPCERNIIYDKIIGIEKKQNIHLVKLGYKLIA